MTSKKRVLGSKIEQDLLWNYSSLVILAVSGILINLIIASFYGVSALGVFNQIYAIYIMLSQFAVGGLHFSSLKYVAEHDGRHGLQASIFFSALFLALIAGALVSTIAFFGSGMVVAILESKGVGDGLLLAAPALLFFAMNKVLMSTFNGLRMMRTFAVAQALRYLLMIGYIVWIAVNDYPEYMLAGSFLFSELLLFITLAVLAIRHFRPHYFVIDFKWMLEHVKFGLKAFFSGVFIEINSRVDVLMLGFFMSDVVVGLYSFAAMLAEGFYQLLVVIRNNMNPVLVKLIAAKKIEELQCLVRKTQYIVYPSMLAIAIVMLGLFLPALSYLPNGEDFSGSMSILIVLLVSFWLVAGFVPFDTILTQAGYPASQSWLNALAMLSNIVLNAALIPYFGGLGAALATGCSFVLAMVYLNVMVRSRLGFSLR